MHYGKHPYFSMAKTTFMVCTMPKRQAIVILPEVNYELSLVKEKLKRES
jgi:hypothetical protein